MPAAFNPDISVNVFFRPPAESFLPAFTTSDGRDGHAPRGPQNRATPWRATEEASAFPLEGGRPRPPKMKVCLARRRGGRRGIVCLSPGLDIILGRWMFLVGYWIFNCSFRGEPYRAAGTAALPGGRESAPHSGSATEEASAFPLEGERLALRSRFGEAWAPAAAYCQFRSR